MFKTHQSYKRPFIYADRQGGSASHDDRHANPEEVFHRRALVPTVERRRERERDEWTERGKRFFFF